MDVDVSKKLIIRMKCSVPIDLALFREDQFTRETVRQGNPTVIKNENGDFTVAIYNIPCGVLDPKSSKALQVLSNSKDVIKQAFVGVDPERPKSHCLVAVNVLAPPASTMSTVEQVLACFQKEWNNHLCFPAEVVQNPKMLPLLKSFSSLKENVPPQAPASQPPQVPASQPPQVPAAQPLQVPAAEPPQVPTAEPPQVPAAEPPQVPAAEPPQVPAAEPPQVPAAELSQVPHAGPPQVPPTETTNSKNDYALNPSETTSACTSVITGSGDATDDVAHIDDVACIDDPEDTADVPDDISDRPQVHSRKRKRGLIEDSDEDEMVPDKRAVSSHKNSESNCTPSLELTHQSPSNRKPTGLPTFSSDEDEDDSALKSTSTTSRDEDNILHQTSRILESIHRQLNSINPLENNITKIASASSVAPELNATAVSSTLNAGSLPNTITAVSACTSVPSVGQDNFNCAISTPGVGSCSDKENLSSIKVKTEPDRLFESVMNYDDAKESSLQPSISSQQSYITSIDGHRTDISDLPEAIRNRLAALDRAQMVQPTQRRRNAPEDDGLPSLLDEGGSTGICNFLLGRNSSNNSSQRESEDDENQEEEEEDDDELNFPAAFLNKRRDRRNDPLAEGTPVAPVEVVQVAPKKENNNDSENDVLVVVKDELDDIFDLMSEFPKDVEMEACTAITSALLPHQKKALNWMMMKENTTELPPFWECITEGTDYFNLGTRRRVYDRPKSVNGGILADDMGLGKTLVTIALVLTNHRDGKTLPQHKQLLPTNPADICITDDYKRKKSKTATNSDFKKPGFQFRQIYLDKLTKGKEKKKKKKQKEEGMFSIDTDDDIKPMKQLTKHVDSIVNNLNTSTTCSKKRPMFGDAVRYCNTSLIVCPMTVISNWTDQFKQHVNPSAKVQIYLYYGADRIRDVEYLQKHDVVITTYGTLSADYRASTREKQPKESPLHKINWLRAVLDEGHIVRNGKSQQAVAAVKINAARRWILTGTVIQNRMSDLWSIINFLHIEPFTNKRWWNEHVTKSMDRRAGPGRVCFNRIRKIIKHIAIRRLKTDKVRGQPLVVLPKRVVKIEYVTLSEDERKVYDSMQKDGKFIVSKFFHANTIFKNYANILVIIMRLRQLCCHPSLCTKSLEKLEKAHNIMEHLKKTLDDFKSVDADLEGGVLLKDSGLEDDDEDRQKLLEQIMMFLASGDSEECSICLEILADPVITRCAHIFCSPCINDVIDSTDSPLTPCPLCRTDIENGTLVKIPSIEEHEKEKENDAKIPVENVTDDEEFVSSAKVDMLMKMLTELRAEDPNVKSLVVSQFTSYLDIVEKPLTRDGFQFVRLDGTMSQSARTDVMEDFKSVDGLSPTIMLLSLTAGGVGLNLISASRVFLLDPAWNPATEEQCFDRCHRLGQKKDVYIHKFIVKDSVEDRMLILQQKKRELMKKAFGNRKQNAQERRRAALQDLGTLLGLNLVRPRPSL